MAKATINEIKKCIAKIKVFIQRNEYDFVPRRKNMQDLAKYGLNITNIKSKLKSLSVSDYHSGPLKDYDINRKNGEIWIFKKRILKARFYIKIKFAIVKNKELLKILSFHEDQ